MSYKKITVFAPGTCGEMVQGILKGKPFLVTCPVDIWTEVTVGTWSKDNSAVVNGYPKMKRAIKEVLIATKENIQLSFSRQSRIPVGKGMSSSTADIAAATLATSRLLGKELSPEEIATLALNIEPSDAIMFPGIHLFDHLYGNWSEPLGVPPPIDVLVIDPGGTVDTVVFNRRRDLLALNRAKEKETAEALQLVKSGIKENDPEKIGRGATISAWANQKILPKKELHEVFRLSKEIQALGVNVAHSGTVMGILLFPENGKVKDAAKWIAAKQPHWSVGVSSLISGGLSPSPDFFIDSFT